MISILSITVFAGLAALAILVWESINIFKRMKNNQMPEWKQYFLVLFLLFVVDVPFCWCFFLLIYSDSRNSPDAKYLLFTMFAMAIFFIDLVPMLVLIFYRPKNRNKKGSGG